MFKLNLKIALRSLWKSKVFSLINIGGLAIGLSSCVVLLLYVAHEWSYDKHIKNYKDTYIVYCNGSSNGEVFSTAWTPGAMRETIQARVPDIELIARSTFSSACLLAYKGNTFRRDAAYADPEFVKILDYKFIKGSAAEALKNPNAVLLTQSMASLLFGQSDPLNKEVLLENKETLIVEGVIEDIPENSSIKFDYLLPWRLYERQNAWVKNAGMNDGKFCLTLVQVTDKKDLTEVNNLLSTVFSHTNSGSYPEAFLYPIAKWRLYSKFTQGMPSGGRIEQLRLFLLLSFVILVIACVNFMNLSTAGSVKRAKEVGVRKAMGASRKILIGQFMLESFVMAFLAMCFAFVMIEFTLPYFNQLFGVSLSIPYQNWQFWLLILLLVLFTGVLAGSYPAIYLSSFEPIKVLKGANMKLVGSFSLRKILVVFQFSFAACLMVCTSFIYLQINYVKNKPIGYQRHRLVEIRLEGAFKSPEKLNLLKQQLLESGAVSKVSFFNFGLSSTGGGESDGVNWPGKSKNDDVGVNIRSAGHDFVATVGAKLKSGRDFSPRFADSSNVIVNEAAVKAMALKDPIGKVLTWMDKPYTIIGVIQDLVTESPFDKTIPMMITNDLKAVWLLEARLQPTNSIAASMAKITAIFEQLNPGFPVESSFVDSNFEERFEEEKTLGIAGRLFAGFTILICCLGLLGLAIHMAEQRKKEISIRKVLGASTSHLLMLLNKDFIKLILIANLIAFPLAYVVVQKWLSGFDYRVGISILPFALVIIVTVLIAILTVTIQSIKVVKAKPVDALKCE